MGGIRIEGNSGVVGDVDANRNLFVNMPTTPSQAGYSRIVGKDGSPLKVTATGYVETSLDSLDFFDTVDGAAVNTNLWNQSVSGMTITQANGFINLNPTNVVTANAYAILSSIQSFFLTDCLPLHFHLRVQSSIWALGSNTFFELGWGTAATNAVPTDGMFVRAKNGVVYAVLNFGGTETEIALTPTFTVPTVNATNEFVLDLYANEMRVFVDGVLWTTGATAATAPVANPAATTNNRQSGFFRVYNASSSPGASPTFRLGQISIQQRNAQFNKPYADKLVGFGRGAYQSPITTFAQTANYANSAAPASATLSNTAAGYTTLGGKFLFTVPASAETDFALFGYQVPAGFQLKTRSIAISAWVSTVLVGGPVVLEWGIGLNSSAVSLATADGAGTWAPRRVHLGQQSFAAAAAVGTVAVDLTRDLTDALVDGARFFHVILRIVSGATSGAIRGGVMLGTSGYFE